MSSKANVTRLKGKGWFANECNKIYVCGSVEGHGFKRKSTGMEANPKNIAYIKKNHRDVLLQILNKDTVTVNSDFKSFGRSVVEAGAKTVGKDGKLRKAGRGELDQRNALSKFENHLLPFFKEYALEEIRAMHVEVWQEKLLLDYSTSTVSKCRNLLREILHKACANDLIMKNPVDYADKVHVEFVKQEAYTVDEARTLMTKAIGWMHTYLNVAFTTGMRTGELMALMWDDVDFENSCIYLQRSVTKGRMTIGSAGGKNHKRVVYVMPPVLEILKTAKEESNCKWLFPSRKGSYFRESKSIVKNHFQPLLEKLEVPYKTLYATRHTFSSVASNLRVDTELMNGMVGNSLSVRDEHYVTFEMTAERAKEAQGHLAPVNNAFFAEIKEEVK